MLLGIYVDPRKFWKFAMLGVDICRYFIKEFIIFSTKLTAKRKKFALGIYVVLENFENY